MPSRLRTAQKSDGVIGYAPGSIGNIGPGLDVLGCALTGAGDEVQVWWSDGQDIDIVDAGHPALPKDPLSNICALAATAVCERIGGIHRGIHVRVCKGLPLAAGQGGSGASAVAAAVAVNQLCIDAGYSGLNPSELLIASLDAESRVSGRHLDNIAASLFGGIICIQSLDPPSVINVPVHTDLWFAIAHPHIEVRTADARAVLPATVRREALVAQLSSVATMMAALSLGDGQLFGQAMIDHVAEEPRTVLIPGLQSAKRAAFDAGAYGAGISGSGPTTFAVCGNVVTAEAVAVAMCDSYRNQGLACSHRVATIDFTGATWRRPHQ